MKPSKKEMGWSEIYSTWQFQSATTGWDQKFSFTPVLVPSPSNGLQIGSEICDWWPSISIANRRAALEKNGLMGIYWQTKKGTFHTAEMLYEYRDNSEAQAAILIAASAWDKVNPPPDAWRGETFRLINNILQLIIRDSDGPFNKYGIINWHHAMRDALPVNIAIDKFAEFSKPQDYNDFIYIAFLDVTLSTSLWTPVIVSHIDHD